MKTQLLVNSSASSVTARRQVLIHRLLRSDHDVEVVETKRRGHATLLARDAAARGIDLIVVLGGDGTLNEVANGLVGTETAVAALPGGSTNVFARTLGLSDDPVEAMLTTLEAIDLKQFERIGLGSVNGRYFLFHTGIGWDARLVRQVERHGELKRYVAHPLFVWAGVRTWFRLYDRTRPHFRITHEDGSKVDDGYFTIVLNSNPYTYVGTKPFNISPDADLSSPLAVVSITKMASLAFIQLMFESLRSPDAVKRSRIVDYRAAVNSMVIEGYGPVEYQVDGDDMGDAERLEFGYHPEALRLLRP
jgi:diacylglycerol kinase family enzyme